VHALGAAVERWARAEPRILAMAEFGSNARSDRPGDEWSDVDLLLVVEDPGPWHQDLGWIDAIGPTWARFVHPSPIPDIAVHQALFAGGYDADLVVVDAATLEGVVAIPEAASAVFGHGVRVVFDRTGVLAPLAAIPGAPDVTLPSAEAFADLVGQVRYQLVWAAKRVRRGELWRVVDDVDGYLARRLLTLVEWAAVGEGRAGVFPDGRRFERWATTSEVDAVGVTRTTYDAADAARAILELQRVSEWAAARVATAYGFELEPADDLRPWLEARLAGD
jgi:aminoglycoside 6-adenylyltransferase